MPAQYGQCTELGFPGQLPPVGKQLLYCKAGAGWCAKDSAGTERCTGSGGGGGGYSSILDEGTPLTSRTILNFIGSSVTCVDNAGATRTDCTVSGGGGAGDITDVGTCATGACFTSAIANTVLAGPASGPNAPADMRSLQAADMPNGTTANIWTIDSDAGGSEPANNSGLHIGNFGASSDVSVLWNSANDELVFAGGAPAYNLRIPGLIGGGLSGACNSSSQALNWNSTGQFGCNSAIAASTATALAANPTDCSANQYATTIAASGNLTCAQVDFTQLSGSIAAGQVPSDLITFAKMQNITTDRLIG